MSLIVSTRDYAFQTSCAQGRLQEFETLDVLPLDEQRRNLMIRSRLPDEQEAADFCRQLVVVAQQTPEMEMSPFLLALLIEVFKSDHDHQIPTKRADLYSKQVNGVLCRHRDFMHRLTGARVDAAALGLVATLWARENVLIDSLSDWLLARLTY